MNKLIGRNLKVKRVSFEVEMVISEIKNITDNILSVSGNGNGKNWTFTMSTDELTNGLI